MKKTFALANYKLGKRMDRIAMSPWFRRIASPGRGVRYIGLRIFGFVTR